MSRSAYNFQTGSFLDPDDTDSEVTNDILSDHLSKLLQVDNYVNAVTSNIDFTNFTTSPSTGSEQVTAQQVLQRIQNKFPLNEEESQYMEGLLREEIERSRMSDMFDDFWIKLAARSRILDVILKSVPCEAEATGAYLKMQSLILDDKPDEISVSDHFENVRSMASSSKGMTEGLLHVVQPSGPTITDRNFKDAMDEWCKQ